MHLVEPVNLLVARTAHLHDKNHQQALFELLPSACGVQLVLLALLIQLLAAEPLQLLTVRTGAIRPYDIAVGKLRLDVAAYQITAPKARLVAKAPTTQQV